MLDLSQAHLTTLIRRGDVLSMTKAIIGLGNSYYPETVFKIFVVNAPFVFRSAYALASRAFEALPDAVRAVHAATGQTQFPISLSLAREPEKEIEQWMQMVRGARERAASAE